MNLIRANCRASKSGSRLALLCLAVATVASVGVAADYPCAGSPGLTRRSLSRSPLLTSGELQPAEADAALGIGTAATPFERLSTASPSDLDGCRSESWLNFADDLDTLPCEFWCDVKSLWTCENVVILLAAGGASWAVHETLDDDVADDFRRHGNRWGKGQEFFAGIGNPAHHFAAVAGLYCYSLRYQDEEVHELSKSLFNAVAITGVSTMLLKAASGTGTVSPNGEADSFGGSWPSGHTSSSFAFAAVLNEYYGPRVGVPAFILAGLVGWERIDDGEHDLSDVVFGAALGYVIGKTVAANHRARFCGFDVQPYIDPVTGTTGLGLERRF